MSKALVLGLAFSACLVASGARAMTGAEVLKSLNHDNDQTLEMPEAIAAAADVFKSLSKDGDMTVDRAEVNGRVSEADWAAVNKDHDRTLELDEWLTVARKRFNAADTDHDGKLDAKELDTAAGQSLVKLIVK